MQLIYMKEVPVQAGGLETSEVLVQILKGETKPI